MLKKVRHILFSAMLAGGMLGVQTAQAEEVYLIRGFLNVFSDGMNQMARQLKSRGIRAKAISNGAWQDVASDIISRAKRKQVSYPIVIAGHSLGGVEAPRFANALGAAGVPVELVIGLDPGFPNPPTFRAGAKRVVNYKIPSGKNYRKGPGFKGSITTIDVSKFGTDHVGIDKNKQVQALVISQIRKAVGK